MKNRNSGFSLLEVMIAIAILAVSLLAIFHLQSTSLIGSARAQKISIATLLAQEKMARVLIDLEKGMKKGEFPEDKEETGSFEEEKYPDFGWKLAIRKTTIPTPPTPDDKSDIMAQMFSMVSEELSKSTREIRLTIYWKDLDDEPEEGLTLTTHMVKMQ